MTAVALAQAPFTIVRPAEGARVREVIKIQIPKNSVPPGGYISVAVNGQFIEATLPEVKGEMYEYPLDTKKRRLADGPLAIEVTLYGPSSGRNAAIIDRSKVNVTLENKAPVKEKNGVLLRYRYRRGAEWIYHNQSLVSLLSISSEEEKRGAIPAEQIVVDETFDSRFTIDNVYPSGNALMRIEPLPDSYGNLVFTEPDGSYRVFQTEELGALYSEVMTDGRSVFYSIPPSFGANSDTARQKVAILLNWSPLPLERQKVGDKWATTISMPGDFADSSGYKSITTLKLEKHPVTGQLVGFEWEQGHPCVHIRYEFKVGKSGSDTIKYSGSVVNNAQYAYVQDFWFATDLGTIARRDETIEIEGSSTVDSGSAPDNSGGGGGGKMGGGGGAGAALGPAAAPPPGGGGQGGAGMGPGGGSGGGLPEGKIRVRIRKTMILRK